MDEKGEREMTNQTSSISIVKSRSSVPQQKQIYLPPDRCHTREREYARKGWPPLGQEPRNVQQQLHEEFKSVNPRPNFVEDDDFWEDLSVNKSNVLRRMSAIGIEGGGKIVPIGLVGNGPEMRKKEQQKMLREVVQKLRKNVDIAAGSVGINSFGDPPKVSRGTSASSRAGFEPRLKEKEKGQNGREGYSLRAKLAAEFSGDLFLVLISSLSALSPSQTSGPLENGLATGLVIFVLIASIGRISGGHFNPAVSFSVVLAGKMPFSEMILYWVAQLCGGTVGALLVRALTEQAEYDSIAGGATILYETRVWYQGFLAEALLTALLVQTILNSAVEQPGNPLASLAIGCTILVDIVGAGTFSGASMNPARSFGPCLVASILSTRLTGFGIWSRHYVYWAGPFTGAAISALAFRQLFSQAASINSFRR